jgi:hypothetical protein
VILPVIVFDCACVDREMLESTASSARSLLIVC